MTPLLLGRDNLDKKNARLRPNIVRIPTIKSKLFSVCITRVVIHLAIAYSLEYPLNDFFALTPMD